MAPVSEVYFYTYTTNKYNYTPQAPISSATTASQSEVWNEPLIKLYSSDKKTQVGYIALCGQARYDPLNDGSNNTQLIYETGVIFMTKNNSLDINSILGSLSYNNAYIYKENSSGIIVRSDDPTSIATSVTGKYAGKVVSLTQKVVNGKTGETKLTIEYEK